MPSQIMSLVAVLLGLLAPFATGSTGETRKLQFSDSVTANGWLEVDESWPFTGDGNFLAWEHNLNHQIEVQYPKRTTKDLVLRLSFFSKWKRAPGITLFPCDGDPISVAVSDGTGWTEHTHKILAADCKAKIGAKYLVHLRDEGDLFAWKLLELTSADDQVGLASLKSTIDAKDDAKLLHNYSLGSDSSNRGLLSLFDDTDDENDENLEVDDNIALSCTTLGCDSSNFRSSHGFILLENGLPEQAQANLAENSLYVNGKGTRLNCEIESEVDLSGKNVCLSFRIYSRNANNSLNLYLRNKNDPKAGEEMLTRVPNNDLALGRRTDFEDMTFCSEDIKPRLFRKDSMVLEATVSIEVVPNDARLFIQINKMSSLELRPLHTIQSHLPDLNQFVLPTNEQFSEDKSTELNVGLLDQYWDLSKLKGSLYSDSVTPQATPVIIMKNIRVDDPNAELSTLSLTSRWLQLDRLSGGNTKLAYRLFKRDYLQQVELQFQSSEHPADASNWFTSSQIVYDLDQEQPKDRDHIEILEPLSLPPDNISTIGEFRLRLVHKFNTKLKSAHLTLLNLAFADLCLEEGFSMPRCKNQGTCKSLDTVNGATVNGLCECKPGWIGSDCSIWDPCENLYGPNNIRGDQFCEQLGAKCVNFLPDMRCQWPGDKFFKQNFVFNEDGTYTIIDDTDGPVPAPTPAPAPTPEPQPTPQPGPQSTTPSPNGGGTSSSSSSTTVLSIIFVGMTFLLIVIIVNMVKRLRKTNTRLEAAESEAFELKRRSQRGHSASKRSSAGQPPSLSVVSETELPSINVVSFQNRPFDVNKSRL